MVDENPSYGAPQQKSGTASVLLWILAIAAVCGVLCCGAAGLAVWRFGEAAKQFVANMTTSDPAEIRKRTDEMVQIDIPDKYQPMQAMNLMAFQMVVYQADPAEDGMLMLMEMTMQQFGVDAKDQEQELRKSMKEQHGNQDFKSTKSETREIEIRGEKIPFEFSEGTSGEGDQAKKIHMISGVFRGKRGPIMLQLTVPDEDYDEEAVMTMLQSIK